MILQKDIYRKTAEIGYWLGEPYWNKGIATEAVKSLVEYAFHELKLVRLYSGVFECNPASMKVLLMCGFQKEGVFQKSVIKNGIRMDEHRFGLVNKDIV